MPDLPRRIAWPLAVGAWTNANAFGVLVFKPDAKGHPAYRAAVAGSFAAVSGDGARSPSGQHASACHADEATSSKASDAVESFGEFGDAGLPAIRW